MMRFIVVITPVWDNISYYISNLPGGRTTYLVHATIFTNRHDADQAADRVKIFYPLHLYAITVKEA